MESYWYGIIISTVVMFWFVRSFFRQRKLPHGPMPIPLVGNLIILKNDTNNVLNKLAHDYGALFTVWFGRKPVIIVNDYNVALEVLSQNDLKFSARPDFISSTLSRRRRRMPFMDYGPDFVKKQSICVEACKLNKEYLQECVARGASNLCELFSYKVVDHGFDPAGLLEDSIMNLMSKIVYGVSTKANFADINLVGHTNLMTVANTTNLFRWLRLLNLKKYYKYRRFVLDREKIFADLFKEFCKLKNSKAMASVIYNHMSREGDDETSSLLCSDIFIIAVENMSAALKWLLLYLVTWPEIQIKVQEELDGKFEHGQSISIADAASVPYIAAAVYEMLRLSSLNPLSSIHQSTESVTLKGHKLPKNTSVCINLNSIHLSAKYWEHPFEFCPERFLTKIDNVTVLKDVKNTKGFIPFGSGVRKCMGDELSVDILATIVANLFFNFTFEIPPWSMQPDLTGTTRLVLVPRPYSIAVTQR